MSAVMSLREDEETALFLAGHLQGHTSVALLEGDASARMYFRVRNDSGTYVLCKDASFINVPESVYPFTVVYDLLKDAVPVPKVFSTDRSRGFLLLQDLGDVLLEYEHPRFDREELVSVYESCLDNLFIIQGLKGTGGVPFSLSFDRKKLMYEFNFFIEHALLGFYRSSLSNGDLQSLKSEFMNIASILAHPQFFVLNHRDYHARNIIITGGIPYIIDFQDARMGLPQYDAVSILRDSYVRLEPEVFEYLKNYYYEGGRDRGIHSMGRDEFDFYFDVMAFQRNIKALGTFGFQAGRGNRKYEKYIGPTVAYLPEYAERQPELVKAWRILARYICD
jgi:aminoglycoside/choline kinase family phosphotransferase